MPKSKRKTEPKRQPQSQPPGPPIPRRRRSKKPPNVVEEVEDPRDGLSQPGDSSFADFIWSVQLDE